MKIVIFGLTVSSSWGNGHATLWRGLCRALAELGHRVVFFEKDVFYYAAHRDLSDPEYLSLVLYENWESARGRARAELADADAAIATSYCPDAVAATEMMLDVPRPVSVFYDLDTPVTLSRLAEGEAVPYIGAQGLACYDLVLSYTGAGALDALRERLGARRVAPLYGHVDPRMHFPVRPESRYRADLSYLGTYAVDRQPALESLFLKPALQRPAMRFLMGGAQYPEEFPWAPNIFFVRHMPPAEHPAFFSSSRLTLNVTRRAMAEMGACPSGRLFEAAACGTVVLTDYWAGIESFFAPGEQVLVARTSDDALSALDLDDASLRRIGAAARERVMSQHTSMHRAGALMAAVESARSAAPYAVVEA